MGRVALQSTCHARAEAEAEGGGFDRKMDSGSEVLIVRAQELRDSGDKEAEKAGLLKLRGIVVRGRVRVQ